MVSFLFRQLAHLVSERQCLGEVLEPERALQELYTVVLDDVSVWNLRAQPFYLGICQRWLITPAGRALHLRQLAHILILLSN